MDNRLAQPGAQDDAETPSFVVMSCDENTVGDPRVEAASQYQAILDKQRRNISKATVENFDDVRVGQKTAQ